MPGAEDWEEVRGGGRCGCERVARRTLVVVVT